MPKTQNFRSRWVAAAIVALLAAVGCLLLRDASREAREARPYDSGGPERAEPLLASQADGELRVPQPAAFRVAVRGPSGESLSGLTAMLQMGDSSEGLTFILDGDSALRVPSTSAGAATIQVDGFEASSLAAGDVEVRLKPKSALLLVRDPAPRELREESFHLHLRSAERPSLARHGWLGFYDGKGLALLDWPAEGPAHLSVGGEGHRYRHSSPILQDRDLLTVVDLEPVRTTTFIVQAGMGLDLSSNSLLLEHSGAPIFLGALDRNGSVSFTSSAGLTVVEAYLSLSGERMPLRTVEGADEVELGAAEIVLRPSDQLYAIGLRVAGAPLRTHAFDLRLEAGVKDLMPVLRAGGCILVSKSRWEAASQIEILVEEFGYFVMSTASAIEVAGTDARTLELPLPVDRHGTEVIVRIVRNDRGVEPSAHPKLVMRRLLDDGWIDVAEVQVASQEEVRFDAVQPGRYEFFWMQDRHQKQAVSLELDGNQATAELRLRLPVMVDLLGRISNWESIPEDLRPIAVTTDGRRHEVAPDGSFSAKAFWPGSRLGWVATGLRHFETGLRLMSDLMQHDAVELHLDHELFDCLKLTFGLPPNCEWARGARPRGGLAGAHFFSFVPSDFMFGIDGDDGTASIVVLRGERVPAVVQGRICGLEMYALIGVIEDVAAADGHTIDLGGRRLPFVPRQFGPDLADRCLLRGELRLPTSNASLWIDLGEVAVDTPLELWCPEALHEILLIDVTTDEILGVLRP